MSRVRQGSGDECDRGRDGVRIGFDRVLAPEEETEVRSSRVPVLVFYVCTFRYDEVIEEKPFLKVTDSFLPVFTVMTRRWSPILSDHVHLTPGLSV